MADDIRTLGDALPTEMARVRDKVIPCYQAIGPRGIFAIAMMTADLDRAARALAIGDVVEMISAYQALKGYEV